MEKSKSQMENMAIAGFGNYYKNRNVLVTGHTGFKGSWISLWLIELGANLTGYSLYYPSDPSLFETLQLHNKLHHITGDINNQPQFEKAIQESKPEIIFHFAAQSLVSESYKTPVQTLETNIIGTAKVLDACRKFSSVKTIIIVTSDKCYHNDKRSTGYCETDALGGNDPYSASKGCAEIITSAYRKSFFNKVKDGIADSPMIASVRAGNVIGGGDWAANRLVPDCVRALYIKNHIELRNPKAVRPWQFVLEPLSAYLWLGKHLAENNSPYSGAWNFGPLQENNNTVEDVVKKIIQVWRDGKYMVKSSHSFPEEEFLQLDINKAVSYLKWKPVYLLNNSIEHTINWYKKFYENPGEILEYSINQIRLYYCNAKGQNIEWTE